MAFSNSKREYRRMYSLIITFLRVWKRFLFRRKFSPVSLTAVTIAFVLIFIWVTSHWHWYFMLYHLLPEERGWLPAIDQKNETLKCEPLLEVARRILIGEEIPLPYGEKQTLWLFKRRVARSTMLNSLQYQNEDMETSEKRKHYSVAAGEIKSRKLFITFGHNCCLYSKQRALRKAKTVGGFDYAHSFNLYSMPLKFRETHNSVLKTSRGAGYWLWKPYILLKTLMENMSEGDFVMYHDAGAYFIRSAGPLLKLSDESEHGILIFNLDKIEQDYTKMDAMILMNMAVADASESFQRLASYVVIKKSCSSVQFVMEWLAYLSDRRIASDDANMMGFPNAKSFRDHRHDQSVMSLLSKKWGIPAMRDPSQWGLNLTTGESDFSLGPYEQIIMHDRLKH